MYLFQSIRKAFTKKPKPVEMIREVFKLLTEEEGEQLNNENSYIKEDMRDKILEFSGNKKCLYSMEKSLKVAKLKLYHIRENHGGHARLEVLMLFGKDLLELRKYNGFAKYRRELHIKALMNNKATSKA